MKVKKCCVLCQKHGGMHTTHNTGECCKYKKDGTPKQGFSKKAAKGQKDHGNSKKTMLIPLCTVKKTQKSLQKKNIARNTATLVILIWNRIVGMVVL